MLAEMTALPDLNFNSPSHTSQDGSFIQDDAVDMQLMMELGSPGAVVGPAAGTGRAAKFAPTSVLSSSWISRAQAKWSTKDRAVPDLLDGVPPEDMDGSFWEDSTINRDWNQNLSSRGLDLSLSPAHSLFSSKDSGGSGGGWEGAVSGTVSTGALEALAAQTGHLSTDSLDMSAVMEEPELVAACATRKRDYVLTFEADRVEDSVLLEDSALLRSAQDVFADARLSDACDRSPLSPSGLHLSLPTQPSSPSHSSVTTWGRIRRSCQLPPSASPDGSQAPKSSSLPNLSRSQAPTSRMLSGAGEGILAEEPGDMPIYDLSGSMSSSQFKSCTGGGDGLSLLRVFQTKLNLRQSAEEAEETRSSGYATAELQDNQHPGFTPEVARVDDYDYSELFVNGRYIDVNHNEIGFAPPTDANERSAAPTPVPEPSSPTSAREDRWTTLASPRATRIAPTKPPRTFASLLETQSKLESSNVHGSPKLVRTSSAVSVSELRESGTQVPVYVVDQSVQTSCWDGGRLVRTIASTTSVWSPTSGPPSPIYAGVKSFSEPAEFPHASSAPALATGVSPDLAFLKLNFSPPSLFPHVAPFPLSLLSQSHLDPETMTTSQQLSLTAKAPLPATPTEEPAKEKMNPFTLDLGPPISTLPALPSLLATSPSDPAAPSSSGQSSGVKSSGSRGVPRDRDSGLGSSGPSHIQDWDSLAALLPKEVLSTYSFFKTNSGLMPQQQGSASIDKPRKRAARFGRRTSRSGGESGGRVASWGLPCLEEEGGEWESETRTHSACHHHCAPPPCASVRMSASCVQPRRACCPCACRHVCAPCAHQAHQPACAPSCLPRWRRYATGPSSRRHSVGQLSDSDSDTSDWAQPDWTRHRHLLSESSESEEELLPEKRARPSSLNRRRPHSVSMDARLDSSFLRGGDLKAEVCEMGRSAAEKPCATCFRLKSPSEERQPLWAMRELSKHPEWKGCVCVTEEVVAECERDERRRRRSQNLVFFLSGLRSEALCEEELAVRKTPLYLQKRRLVEATLAAVEGLVADFSACPSTLGRPFRAEMEKAVAAVWARAQETIIPAFVALLSDGLLPGRSLWQMIQASTNLGPATKSIHELVTDLKALGKRDGAEEFLKGLLDLNSSDCWLSYLALKDRVLTEHYEDGGFMRRATTAYRSLFARLMVGLQSLSLLPFSRRQGGPKPSASSDSLQLLASERLQRPAPRSASVPSGLSRKAGGPKSGPQPTSPKKTFSMLPTRLPADSRIPKSSSIPGKLGVAGMPKSLSACEALARKAGREGTSPSRIPVLRQSPSMPLGRTKSPSPASPARPRFVCTIARVAGSAGRGVLGCEKGETLELVGSPVGRLLRCRRPADGRDGLVPRELLSFQTFL